MADPHTIAMSIGIWFIGVRALYTTYVVYVDNRIMKFWEGGDPSWDSIAMFPVAGDINAMLWGPMYMFKILNKAMLDLKQWSKDNLRKENTQLKQLNDKMLKRLAKVETTIDKLTAEHKVDHDMLAAIAEVDSVSKKVKSSFPAKTAL